jgi:transposase
MATKEGAMRQVKYVVRLEAEERQQLLDLVAKGKRAASVLTRARILLKADAGSEGPEWDDSAIAEALDASLSSVHRARQAFVDEGLESALYRKKPTGRQYRKLDGDQEARLVVLACSAPPAGRASWTLQLLADQLVALKIVDSISGECVRTTLKKTNSSPGWRSSG